MALILALKSPELRVRYRGGRRQRQHGARDASDALPYVRSPAGPTSVYKGANMPLRHEKANGQARCTDDGGPTILRRHRRRVRQEASRSRAARWISSSARWNPNPGQVTIAAIGPLTNIAMALRQKPGSRRGSNGLRSWVARSLRSRMARATSPNAEFNIWVDPEAARIVFRSGIPINLTPLNVTRKTKFSREWYRRSSPWTPRSQI